MKEKHFFWVVGLILLAAFSRLIPHPPNFTPVLAIAIFSGATLNRKVLAWTIPVLSMLLTDFILGFHPAMWAVYLSLFLMTAMGFTLKEKTTALRVGGVALSGATLFFVLTNFAVWLGNPAYPQNLAGLSACFVAAIPFFHHTLISTFAYVGILFGLLSLVTKHWSPRLA